MAPDRAHPALAFCLTLPWLFLACFGIFLASVTLSVGHFPSYSDPDPKHIDGLAPLYLLTMQLLLATAASPLIICASAAIAASWVVPWSAKARPSPATRQACLRPRC